MQKEVNGIELLQLIYNNRINKAINKKVEELGWVE